MFEFNRKPNDREECLRKANECVNGARISDYGVPEDNFSLIAGLWTEYTGHIITAEDVTMMMVLLKAARVRTGYGSSDNYVDICGYAACAYEGYNKLHKEGPEQRAITEVCPNCGAENTIEWNTDEEGYTAYCPRCGAGMMLCDDCQHSPDYKGCDWNEEQGCMRKEGCDRH